MQMAQTPAHPSISGRFGSRGQVVYSRKAQVIPQPHPKWNDGEELCEEDLSHLSQGERKIQGSDGKKLHRKSPKILNLFSLGRLAEQKQRSWCQDSTSR